MPILPPPAGHGKVAGNCPWLDSNPGPVAISSGNNLNDSFDAGESAVLPENDFARALSTALKEMYDRAAVAGEGLLAPVPISRGRELLAGLGYPERLVDQVPEEYLDKAFPCACPLEMIGKLAPKRVIDLGCGAGLDLILCALEHPGIETLYGIDTSPQLRRRGARLRKLLALSDSRIRFDDGDLNRPEELDFPPADLILMNGSFNLVYDKPAFLQNLAARIGPGGRLLIYDFLLSEPLPAGFGDDLDNWLWNIAGAQSQAQLEQLAAGAGLKLSSCRELEHIAPVISAEIVLAPT
jgi:SAM-dependent methyltransferase